MGTARTFLQVRFGHMMRIDIGFSFMWHSLERVSGFGEWLMKLLADGACGTEKGDEW
jgi:hypothetical protein